MIVVSWRSVARYLKNLFLLLSLASLTVSCAMQSSTTAVSGFQDSPELIKLGRMLFFDVNLSLKRTQACISCHAPERAFTDSRDNGVAGAVSLGDDGVSLGERNAPTVSYAFLAPGFHQDSEGEYVGGHFHDGRAATLVAQAGDPITNPAEMAMPDIAAISTRIRENSGYVVMFKRLFGASVFSNTEWLDAAIRESIAAFEETELFAPFDSKYDRYLRGEYTMTSEEELGRQLFFSTLINCNSCHMLHSTPGHEKETFTNYHYHNIGVPPNRLLNKIKNTGPEDRDNGLLDNPLVDDPSHLGKYKVPTLRNVAVTGPYMHNGVFSDLRTAVVFYSQYLVSNAENRINPETGKAWEKPEVSETIAMDLLREGQPLDDARVDSLVAFLRTLTDRRYEHLIGNQLRINN